VVVTGPPDVGGEPTSVDPALVGYFQTLHLHPNVLKDWDIRNISIVRPRASLDDFDFGAGL
jgi:hypothetical protein